MIAGDAENDSNPEPRQEEDSKTDYIVPAPKFPVYCQISPLNEYWIELLHNTLGQDWQEIRRRYADPDFESFTDFYEQNGECDRFSEYSLEGIYDFHKHHIGGPDNSNSFHPFTHFTFIVIDQNCLSYHPEQCIICCDAPGYNETAPTLKTVRVPLSAAASIVVPLEQLTMTFSEALDPSSEPLSSYPPFTQIEVPDMSRMKFGLATPAQARAHKEEAILLEEERDVSLKVGPNDRIVIENERYARIFRTPRKEAESVTDLYWGSEQLARHWGYHITHHDNRSKECKDKGWSELT